jgi:hypothetical protein
MGSMPSSVLVVKIRALTGSWRASYSWAIDLAELRYAGCVVTSSTLSPFKNTVLPSRKLSKYSLPIIIGTSPIHNLSIWISSFILTKCSRHFSVETHLFSNIFCLFLLNNLNMLNLNKKSYTISYMIINKIKG